MLQTLEQFDRVPRILRLNVAGQPVEWVSWQDAVCLYARDLRDLDPGRVHPAPARRPLPRRRQPDHHRHPQHRRLRAVGWWSRIVRRRRSPTRRCSLATAICASTAAACSGRPSSPATMWCRNPAAARTAGTTSWPLAGAATTTRAAACRTNATWNCSRCRTAPNLAEYLALTNSGRILIDQMDFPRHPLRQPARRPRSPAPIGATPPPTNGVLARTSASRTTRRLAPSRSCERMASTKASSSRSELPSRPSGRASGHWRALGGRASRPPQRPRERAPSFLVQRMFARLAALEGGKSPPSESSPMPARSVRRRKPPRQASGCVWPLASPSSGGRASRLSHRAFARAAHPCGAANVLRAS